MYLCGVYLCGVYLCGVYLCGVYLCGIYLCGTFVQCVIHTLMAFSTSNIINIIVKYVKSDYLIPLFLNYNISFLTKFYYDMRNYQQYYDCPIKYCTCFPNITYIGLNLLVCTEQKIDEILYFFRTKFNNLKYIVLNYSVRVFKNKEHTSLQKYIDIICNECKHLVSFKIVWNGCLGDVSITHKTLRKLDVRQCLINIKLIDCLSLRRLHTATNIPSPGQVPKLKMLGVYNVTRSWS